MGMFGSKYAEVPDLKGKTEKEAEKILRQSHLEIGNISRDYSDDYPENKIIKTKPKQGERVNQHEKVDIVLSKGPERAKMPNVIGMKKVDALDKLKQSKLDHVTVNQEYNNQVPKGAIAKQSVNPDSYVRINDHQITLTESLGVKKVYVKNYENKNYQTAKKELEKNGLKVQMTTESSNNVKKDNIISQSPKNTDIEEEVQFNSLFQKEKHLQKMKTKIQRNLNLLVKTSLMIHKKLRIIQKHITSHIREMTKVKKFKFTLEIRTIVAHLLAKRLV